MLAQVQRTASQVKSTHLLRALLREASYLPDATARTYFRRYIVNRFRAYQPRERANQSKDARAVEKYTQGFSRRRHESIINERTRAMQRRARKGLNYMRRATTLGDLPCMEKILLFTYGRLGPRRYALLEHLLRPDAPEEHAQPPALPLAPLQQLYHSNLHCLAFFDAPKKKTPTATHYHIEISDRYSRLKTVLKTQHASGITMGRSPKTPYLTTPVTNIWHRPMPINRARNTVRRWYADAMGELLPPLPNEEWDAIKAMMDGKKYISFVKRRTPAAQHIPEPLPEDAAFAALVNEAMAMDKPSRADRLSPSAIHRPRTLNTRFMRRVYAKVLRYCCKLEYRTESNKWLATWGNTRPLLSSPVYSAPVDDALFSGVNEAGLVMRKKREPQPGEAEPGARSKKQHSPVPFYVDYLPTDHPMRVEAENFRRTRGEVRKASGGVSRFEAATSRSGGTV